LSDNLTNEVWDLPEWNDWSKTSDDIDYLKIETEKLKMEGEITKLTLKRLD